jgi:hypothetical protein
MILIRQKVAAYVLALAFLISSDFLLAQVLPDQVWLHGINDFIG